ncbi:hypothetical protein P692DRAFT_20870776, partial [Suillus brevipes Sb2]
MAPRRRGQKSQVAITPTTAAAVPVTAVPIAAVPITAVPIAAAPIAAVPIAAVPIAAAPIAAVPIAAAPIAAVPIAAAVALNATTLQHPQRQRQMPLRFRDNDPPQAGTNHTADDGEYVEIGNVSGEEDDLPAPGVRAPP